MAKDSKGIDLDEIITGMMMVIKDLSDAFELNEDILIDDFKYIFKKDKTNG